MELTGKIIKVLPMQSGTSTKGEWRKQEFVIEVPGTYPKKVALSAWNEKAQEVQSLGLGQEIKAQIDIESREYNERWYTDIRAWKIEKAGTTTTAPSSNAPTNNNAVNNPSPFDSPADQNNNPFGDNNDPSKSQEDDLPF
ncbi:MAG: DUF3127 domain-containing protein [Bacteroidia bacterium]|nr:DUF3127 domain-containing protein [Bacteroidota bacterium]MCZ2130317.1 DUF3127 domain-containing protein [Bacteroidia bacterium]